MKLRFKSEEHRKAFASLAKCNQWIAEKLGLAWWNCEYDRPNCDCHGDENERNYAIMVMDSNGDIVTGKFYANADENDDDAAWIFSAERQYFDIEEISA